MNSGAVNPTPAICLVCRSVLDRGEACDLDPRHPVAALADFAHDPFAAPRDFGYLLVPEVLDQFI